MFRNTFQVGFLSILYSLGNESLQLWSCHSPEKTSQNCFAHIEKIVDEHINSTVIEIVSPNLSNTFITCPSHTQKTLGIKLPFVVLVVKNLEKFFSFEIEILDDLFEKRRIRASNYQISTRVKTNIATLPMRLDPGWNQVIINLGDYVKKAFGTNYNETSRICIHANCRVRRVYFTDRLYAEDELPAEFKLFLPIDKS